MEHKIAKSKSLNSLTSDDLPIYGLCKMRSYNYGKYRRTSESSVEVFIVNDSASDEWCDEKVAHDSGLEEKPQGDNDIVDMLEYKLDKLNELFQEQCQLLNSIKENMHHMHNVMQKNRLGELERRSEYSDAGSDVVSCNEEPELNDRARSLLNAIEKKQASCLDRVLKDTLTDLLNSEDLKKQLASSTASLLRDRITSTLSRDMSAIYLPIMQRFNRKLLRVATRTLEEAFSELEYSSNFSKFATSAARALRRSLDQHRVKVEAASASAALTDTVLQQTIKTALAHELVRWRTRVLYSLPDCLPLEDELASPPQPPNPDTTLVDQLMRSAEIKKKIQDGDITGSLTRALCANDLSLVVAACRDIDPEKLFRPCKLPVDILLSLVQQLSTDMVHDTQLKCRFLEESVIALGSSRDCEMVQMYIGVVCGELKSHLADFLQRFPSHAATTRLTLILMAVDGLMN